MKIAMLYMCTGNYTIFWDNFFTSCEKFFLPDTKKHYFVFTDGEIAHTEYEHVHRIEQENLGWPDNTLMRYHAFLGIAQELADFDYCYFFNANSEFCAPVGEEFLPKNDCMLFVQHPGFYDKSPDRFTYDRNKQSQAYIPYGQGKIYICGGVNGATMPVYINFMKEICAAVNNDAQKNVVALWHDESHSNKYALTNPHTMHSPSYCYPDNWALPFMPKVRIRAKEFYGGHDYLRGDSKTPHFTTPPNITTCLEGGLGNQMFQYAAGRALAFRLNTKLTLNTHWFKQERANDTTRKYCLDIFPKLMPEVTLQNAQGLIHKQRAFPRWKRAFLKLFPFLRGKNIASDLTITNLEKFQTLKAPMELIGYWQKEEYFADIAFLLREEFAFPPLPTLAQDAATEINKCQESVSVHIRRGDYAHNPHTLAVHGLCSADYYAKAIEHIKKHIPTAELFIFSDEPAWVKENFDTFGLRSTIIDLHGEQDAHHDMHLMSLCKHHIIANSSFSWWGAWLGERGIVIAPQRWFQAESHKDTSPVPDRWIKL